MLYMLLVLFLLHSGMEEEQAIEQGKRIASQVYLGAMIGLFLIFSVLYLMEVIS